jgi:hypothetical protein
VVRIDIKCFLPLIVFVARTESPAVAFHNSPVFSTV